MSDVASDPGSSSDVPADSHTCRICYGTDERTDPLFQPCNCDGSMAYVHVSCLDSWRSTSVNPKSFFECETCKFKYLFGQQRIPGTGVVVDHLLLARLLGSGVSTHALTLALLVLIIFLSGFVVKAAQPTYTWGEVWSCFNLEHIINGATATGVGSLCGWVVSAAGAGVGYARIFGDGIGVNHKANDKAGNVLLAIMVVAGLALAASWIYGALEKYSRRTMRAAQHVVLDAPGRVPHID